MELFDAVVVGAGPAGSTLARTLSKSGFKVLLVEKETPGSRRVCGGFAGPEITDFFSSAGLSSEFSALPKNRINEVRISGSGRSALDTSFSNGPGWAVDRSIFDAWLAKEAVLGGTELSVHSTVTSSRRSSSVWEIAVEKDKLTRKIRSRFLLITSGRRTPKPSQKQKIFFACKTVYKNTFIPQDRVTLHFIKKGHVGLNPLGNGKIAMCLYVESSYLRASKGDLDRMMEDLKNENQNLAEDLLSAKRITDWQTCVAEPDHKRVFYEDGAFFAGDALTMVNPIIGGGMSIATTSAQMLGDLIVNGAAQRRTYEQIALDYEKKWSGRFAKRVGLAASLGTIERSRSLSEALLFLMDLAPVVFSKLVRSARKDPYFNYAQKPVLT